MSSATKILDIAETRMRRAGYNAVSYRDIAAEMGIKSASLHYHFPKKEDLGVALVKRYAANFSRNLFNSTIMTDTHEEELAVFVNLYRTALEDHQLVCLCAVLGAEAPGLPEPVTNEVRAFFEENILWLTNVFTGLGKANPEKSAKIALSLLEGAMIVSSVNNDNGVFDAAAESVLTTP
ncbi:MAG: TetR/AcrR family transcriptional regulator [Litorimonas sp.]